jgi:hypothetical protein
MVARSAPGTSPSISKEALFSGTVLVLSAGLLVSAAWLAVAYRRSGPGPKRLTFAAACLLLAVLLLAALRFSVNARTALAVSLLSLVVAAYLAELALRWTMTHELFGLAGTLGLPYDGRTAMEVARDLQAEGKKAFSEAHPIDLLPRAAPQGLVPLAGVSGATTVLCNETGIYVTYASDEHGFRNPSGLWAAGALQVAALGDSFTHGMCVADGLPAVDRIRRVFPRTLNLGISGDGPLLELATLKEYLPALKPARVLWFYFEGNDLSSDLDVEKGNPILRGYLTDGFTQNLTSRQEEVDAKLQGWLAEIAAESAAASGARRAKFWRDLLTLQQLKHAVLQRMSGREPPKLPADLGLFRQILEEAARTVSGWGGKLYFVYVPWQARFRNEGYAQALDARRTEVLALARGLGIALIDLQPVVQEKGGLSLYVPRPAGHFTAAGYEIVAASILERLQEEEKKAGGESSGPALLR